MSRIKPLYVLVNGAKSSSDLPGFRELPEGVEAVFVSDDDGLRKHLPQADILLGWNFRADDLQRWWSNAHSLKWIHWCGAGVDAALFPALVNSEVTLTNSRGIFNRAMAEYALGYMLFSVKNFHQTIKAQSVHVWEYSVTQKLAGQSVAIFGVGGIGKEIGRLLKAVGLQVTGVGRTKRKGDACFDKVVSVAESSQEVSNADWIIGILPATEETKGIFNNAFFSSMKPGSRFINLGRGSAVDEQALETVLTEGHLSGAMLDVFENEPLAGDHRLWTCPNLFISPHMSGDYHGFEEAMVDLFFTNLYRYLEGKELENVVDKKLGFISGRV